MPIACLVDVPHARLIYTIGSFRVIVQTGNLEKLRKWKKFAAQIRDDYLLVPKYPVMHPLGCRI